MKTHSLIILATALFMASCGGSKKEEATTVAVEETATQIKIATLASEQVDQTSEFTGTVESFTQNDICPSTPVRIESILVEVGDKVKKGQVLVEMDIAQRKQMQVQLDNIEQDYKRISELQKAGGASQQQVDQVRVQMEVQQTAMKNLTENTTLRAPFDGVITGRYYHPGEMFSMSPTKSGKAAILTIMTLSPLKITINVNEEYFPKVKRGMSVDVTSEIYPDAHFKGSVHLIYPTIDPATRTFPVEVSIPNADLRVRPGMYARVNVNFGAMKRVVVPDVAVIKQVGTNDRYVFVHEDGMV
ncbi:MAG: efflux RND transporter periplasmic adaptor subunit, partial [Bacteroidales bacterium]|nr:efflux RND transporter periplasmic adaptor subunit [Bacteroidales bacterium]